MMLLEDGGEFFMTNLRITGCAGFFALESVNDI